MSKRRQQNPKLDALRQQRLLNPKPETVTDRLFLEYEFFDACDLLQVKYEMIRRVETDGAKVTDAAASFGFSRPTFYQVQSAFRRHGLAGLVPKKRGPRSGYKLTNKVVSFIKKAWAKNETLDTKKLARLVHKRFGFRIHPRSIERALQRKEKKRR